MTLSKKTQDLLLANHKTEKDFLEIVNRKQFSLYQLEAALSEAQYWHLFENAVKVAGKGDLGLMRAVILIKFGEECMGLNLT